VSQLCTNAPRGWGEGSLLTRRWRKKDSNPRSRLTCAGISTASFSFTFSSLAPAYRASITYGKRELTLDWRGGPELNRPLHLDREIIGGEAYQREFDVFVLPPTGQ
jgi:hypothetical protein